MTSKPNTATNGGWGLEVITKFEKGKDDLFSMDGGETWLTQAELEQKYPPPQTTATKSEDVGALAEELLDLSKSFEDEKSYKGYMVKQIISARVRWVSADGKTHIGIADLGDVAHALKEKPNDPPK